ncbi:Alpha/Beta hydrolase protein [Hypoxylon rubiginosum]|uniref:Alpha/Beta hydrolase protein n=1 Tax=Hypoxylon rubiginosum TaxID=110542 RepID=A0ACB9YJE2_9PEZI|nr:Alpha/Beta hydrolase protein [Hypoxylon rubiginosum]
MLDAIAEESLVLADGRTLCYTTFADPSSSPTPVQSGTEGQSRQRTVFYFHGYPGTYHEGLPFHEAASKKGIRVVAVTRPGFGGSTHQPNRTLLSFAIDVLAVADHLRIDRFAIIGMSGGCPYALACLHTLPRERLLGVVVVSGLYPISLGIDGMMLLNRVIFTFAPWVPSPILSLIFDSVMGRPARNAKNPEKLVQDLAASLESRTAEDAAAIRLDSGKFLKGLAASTRDAFRHGAEGSAWEAKLFSGPWGFDLKDLKAEKGKLVMWHGSKDVNCPVQMAEKAARLIPNADLRVEKEEAHISLIIKKLDEFVDALLGMFE